MTHWDPNVWSMSGVPCSRLQLPLKLCWSVAIHPRLKNVSGKFIDKLSFVERLSRVDLNRSFHAYLPNYTSFYEFLCTKFFISTFWFVRYFPMQNSRNWVSSSDKLDTPQENYFEMNVPRVSAGDLAPSNPAWTMWSLCPVG